MEKTLAVIKPDGVNRRKTEMIISRFLQEGFEIAGMKMIKVDKNFISKHYPESMAKSIGEKAKSKGVKMEDPLKYGQEIVESLRDYLSEGPVIAIVLRGENAVQRAREIVGFTDPTMAKKGTIRGDHGQDSFEKANSEKRSVRNLVHVSENAGDAQREISLWFKKNEIFD